MSWLRRLSILGLALLLTAAVSCSTGDSNPMGPSVQPIQQQSQPLLFDGLGDGAGGAGGLLGGAGGLLGGVGQVVGGVLELAGGIVSDLLNVTGLLSCQEQKYDVEYQTIGPKGGTIKVGKHALVIPKGALNKSVRIKAEQLRGPTNSVRFSPEGLQFEKSATLILDYRNCQDPGTPKAVVYTSEQLKVLEILKSLDLLRARTIAAPIDHFSRYAVAY
jgi:hypothetical protein